MWLVGSMELLGAVHATGLFVGTLVVGVVAHETSHFVALRLAGIPCRVELLPTRADGRVSPDIWAPLARVRPTPPIGDVAPAHLRVAALMPLWLAAPLVLIFAGVLPDPFASGSVGSRLVLIAWIGCSIPSPQDFALAWYPEQAIATAAHAASSDP